MVDDKFYNLCFICNKKIVKNLFVVKIFGTWKKIKIMSFSTTQMLAFWQIPSWYFFLVYVQFFLSCKSSTKKLIVWCMSLKFDLTVCVVFF